MPPHPDDGSPFFQLARVAIQQASFAIEHHPEERERIAGHHDRIERLLTAVLRLQTLQPNCVIGIDGWVQAITNVRTALATRLDFLNVHDQDIGMNADDDVIPAIIKPCIQIKTGGRPKFIIDWEVVLAYRCIGYQWVEIAEWLGISSKTLRRRREEDNIPEPVPFATITAEELDQIVRNIIQQSAGVIGSQFMQSALRDLGLRVERRRIRESVARVDPLGNYNRWSTMIPRSVYSVAGPNSLWHMDGNLKLREYGFVLHGAIDGFSRYVIYLEANLNNRAETVLNAFLCGVESVQQIPIRVRADKGGENRDVALWMIATQGENCGSFITGRSVHNQRIERLWRDVNRWLTSFHLIFQYLHANGIYNSDDPIDQFTIAFVYLPILRRSLSKFVRVWNHHKLRSEGHRTPSQLYLNFADIHSQYAQSLLPTITDYANYGVDWDGPLPVNILEDEEENFSETGVVVNPAPRPISDVDWTSLQDQYHSLLDRVFRQSNEDWMLANHNYGVDFYEDIRNWIKSRLN